MNHNRGSLKSKIQTQMGNQNISTSKGKNLSKITLVPRTLISYVHQEVHWYFRLFIALRRDIKCCAAMTSLNLTCTIRSYRYVPKVKMVKSVPWLPNPCIHDHEDIQIIVTETEIACISCDLTEKFLNICQFNGS